MQYPGSLHNHTDSSNFRLRDCIIKTKDLINCAVELGHKVVAVTDHETISAAVDVEKIRDKINENGEKIKVIMGNEIYLCRNDLTNENYEAGKDKYYHFILLAKDREGFKQICELSTRAWLRSYMSRGMRRVPTYYRDIVEIITANPGHVIGSTACFLPGQLVRTLNGDKKIEDITKEDYIMTAKGEWEKINFPTSRLYNGKGNILTFTKEPKSIKCTKNHQFLVYNQGKLEWKEAKDLKKNDKCLEPISKIQYKENKIFNILKNEEIAKYREKTIGKQNYSTNIFRLKNEIKITNNIMRLFGLWLADGHISIHEEYNKHEIGFTFSDIEFEIYYNGFVKQALFDLGLNEQDYSIIHRPEHHRIDLSINKVEFCLFMKSIFGVSHANNKFIPQNLINITKDFNAELFFGYMLGDGYFRYREDKKTGEVVATSISKQLIKDFEQLGLSLELSGSITISKARKDKNNVNHQQSYYLTYSNSILGKSLTKEKHISHEELIEILDKSKVKKPQFLDFITIDDVQYRIKKVKTNEIIDIDETVYCLNTNSHNFVLNNIIVHNCLGGMLGTQLLKYKQSQDPELWQKILKWCEQMKNCFAQGDFYLELQPSATAEQTYVNRKLIEISNILNIPYIITTDSHYLKLEDRTVHKAFLNAQDGDREVDSFYATTYMMSTEELESYLDLSIEELAKAYTNILSIADKCENYSIRKALKIPTLKWNEYPEIKNIDEWIKRIPMFKTFLNSDYIGDKELVKATIHGILKHPDLQNDEAYAELNSNLETTWISSNVNKAHWSAYYLNLQKIIDLCWEAGSLVGPGRGSGVGFLLLYALDIIQINKMREETPMFAWRFLNPERVSVLDVDFDIEGGEKREAVLNKFREFYGEDRIANVTTLRTEKSKSAILTSCRGLGIDIDIAQYIASLIPADRGQLRTLDEVYYGNAEKDFKPISAFVEIMKDYPEVWQVAHKIEGLICGTGIHAGGVIFVDEPFTESTALMRAPDGTICTQFDLHTSEEVSLIKYDSLSVEAMDKLHECLNLLIENKLETAEPTLRETYEKIIGVYNLERDNEDMWKMVWEHKIQSLFQMEKQSGIQGIALVKPKNVNELSVLNSVIRLMAPDKNSETPLVTWSNYRKNISLWINEMRAYGLNEEEIDWLSHHPAITDGICESQEGCMSLVQEERLGGNSLTFADKVRKGIAKKQGKLFEECEKIYYENIKLKNCSEKLAHYVWDVLLRVQRGYSFNRSHCFAYSIVALQEMNLAFKYPTILWDCACLIVNSGIGDAATDYKKIAKAIGDIHSRDINVSLIDINNSQYTFKPDVANNEILFGMKGLNKVGAEVVDKIIAGRPYKGIVDFMARCPVNKQVMISLIKAGAFDKLDSNWAGKFNADVRIAIMIFYLSFVSEPKKRLTLQNFNGMLQRGLIPDSLEFEKQVYLFNKYLKNVSIGDWYRLDGKDDILKFYAQCDPNQDFLEVINGVPCVKKKEWDKIYKKKMDIVRDWLSKNQESLLNEVNYLLFKELWDKYAEGSLSAWEMDSLCFYYHPHELINVDKNKYGIVDFNSLPEQPIVEKTFERLGRKFPIYKLSRIVGTVIGKDSLKSSVTLLTTTGVVNVKFTKEYFSMFDRRISEADEEGTKKIKENSWFTRGSMILITGLRREDTFVVKKYKSTYGHQLYKITKIENNGHDIEITHDRWSAEEE